MTGSSSRCLIHIRVYVSKCHIRLMRKYRATECNGPTLHRKPKTDGRSDTVVVTEPQLYSACHIKGIFYIISTPASQQLIMLDTPDRVPLAPFTGAWPSSSHHLVASSSSDLQKSCCCQIVYFPNALLLFKINTHIT